LKSNEVLVEIQLPDETANMNGLYTKFSPRSRIDLATVSVAVVLRLTEDKKRFADIRIGLGAVAPTPIRASSAEAVLKDQDTDTMRLVGVAAKAAVKDASPFSDIRASDSYRNHLIRVLTARTIEAVCNIAKHGRG
jgi:carbon-monoxide dehydrogenase medium subunit